MSTARQPPLSSVPKDMIHFVHWLIEQVDNINARIDKLLGAAGYLAQFDADGNIADSGKLPPTGVIVGDTDTQTLAAKTFTAPVINQGTQEQPTINQPTLNQPVMDKPNATDMTDMNHDHESVAGGGTLGAGALGTAFLDEDDMASDSDAAVASQQSIKAYVDGLAPAGFTGSFTTGDATTATVVNGLITGVA
jgi:hypothetical protein